MLKKINLILVFILSTFSIKFADNKKAIVQSEKDSFVFTVKSKKRNHSMRGFKLGALVSGCLYGAGTLFYAIFQRVDSFLLGFVPFCFTPVIMLLFGLFVGIEKDLRHTVYDYVDPEEPSYVAINKKYFIKA